MREYLVSQHSPTARAYWEEAMDNGYYGESNEGYAFRVIAEEIPPR